MTDLKFAIRYLLRNPGFSVVAVLMLTIGIGATTGIFSVVYAVVLRPLPFPESEQLVAIWTQTPEVDRLPMAAANHRDLKSQAAAFEDIALSSRPYHHNLTADGEPERLTAVRVAANLFPLLRMAPALGRGFTEDESRPGQDRVVILSHALWQRRYAGDRNIVGRTIRLDDVLHTVVGVMGLEFRFPTRDVQMWLPLTLDAESLFTRTGHTWLAVARLKPGVTAERAQTEVSVIATRLEKQYPGPNQGVRFNVVPLRLDTAGAARRPLIVLLGALFGLLLIGCCNLVNLLLARALARSRETAVRVALGATGPRLIREAATELLPILLLGSLAGVLAAKWGIQFVTPSLPASLPRRDEIQVNLPALLFSGCVLIVVAMMMVFVPAARTVGGSLAVMLRADSRTSSGTAGKPTIRNLLVVAQVALTVILLTGAGLLIRTFGALNDVNAGFRPQGVLSLQLAIPRAKYRGDDQAAAFCQRILEQVRALPGVEAAGMGNRLPLDVASGLSSIEFERTNQEPVALAGTDETTITPDYFQAMGIQLLEGRPFEGQDTMNAPPVVIVDDGVARAAWPGESPIGKRVRGGPHRPWAAVVGVVGHVRHESLEDDKRLQIYWNYLQRPRDRMTLVVRTAGDTRPLISGVLQAIRAVDPDQPVYAIRTMTEVLDRYLALRRFNTVTVSLFAGSSLLLAMVGIYGVIAWTVRRRTREIGIRMALGAQRSMVTTFVLRRGLTLAVAGTLFGIIGALGLTPLLRSMLFGVGTTDPLTFTVVPLLLVAVALLASWLPARRAARVDPMEALRYE
jgi:putative ABC transport system permease protein